MQITNAQVGGFLIAEGLLSFLYAPNKDFLPQASRIVRMGIGFYIHQKVPFVLYSTE